MLKRAVFLVLFAAVMMFISRQTFATSTLGVITSGYMDGSSQYFNQSWQSDGNVSYGHAPGSTIVYGEPASGSGYSDAGGYSDSGNPKMGVYSVSESNNYGYPGARGSSSAGSSNYFTVAPGTSGYADGDTVPVNLAFRLDGSANASGSGGYAYMFASLDVSDLDNMITTCPDGCYTYPTPAFNFDGHAGIGYETINNWTGTYQDGASWEDSINGGPYNSYSSTPSDFDTGLQSIAFDAIVGDTYEVDAGLYASTEALGTSTGESSFNDTFSTDFTPRDGTQLTWYPERPAVNSVPEPPTLELLAVGLLGMAVLGMRKRFETERREGI